MSRLRVLVRTQVMLRYIYGYYCFQGSHNFWHQNLQTLGDGTLVAVKGLQRLFKEERYKAVTPDELASIKVAMVSGRGGIVTHSGH
ncbi:hypothetical protein PG991_009182 [Apiospora marii]|uniref:Uncharacterized protein n=1 Tax=Apiospora marii TaxID=335849 RepID=A0ABR1RJY9_9PEZI